MYNSIFITIIVRIISTLPSDVTLDCQLSTLASIDTCWRLWFCLIIGMHRTQSHSSEMSKVIDKQQD